MKDLKGVCEIEFMNGEVVCVDVKVVMIDSNLVPLWVVDVDGWNYPCANIKRMRESK